MSLSTRIAHRLRTSPALSDKNEPLPGAKYSRLAAAAIERGEPGWDPGSYEISEAPYTASPAERLRAVERHTETVVEPMSRRWA